LILKAILISLIFGIPSFVTAQNMQSTGLSNTTGPDANEYMPDHTDLITPIMMRGSNGDGAGLRPVSAMRNKAGYALAGSAIIPGLSQVAHGNWFRAGLYLAVEVATLYTFIEYRNRGNRGERSYENFSDQNWSVVQYANWIIDYHDVNNLSNPHLEDLQEIMNGRIPSFDTSEDWQGFDINVLRATERSTPYITTDDQFASNFSHVLPSFGSQQYYELISKYYQYASGWKDYYAFHVQGNTNPYLIDRTGGKVSPLFWEGRDQAEEFNDNFRFSNNMLSLLILNHFVSAFDAYFTVRFRNRHIETSFGGTPASQFRLTYHF